MMVVFLFHNIRYLLQIVSMNQVFNLFIQLNKADNLSIFEYAKWSLSLPWSYFQLKQKSKISKNDVNGWNRGIKQKSCMKHIIFKYSFQFYGTFLKILVWVNKDRFQTLNSDTFLNRQTPLNKNLLRYISIIALFTLALGINY